LFWLSNRKQSRCKTKAIAGGNQHFSTSRYSTDNNVWPPETDAHMYRETRYLDHPGPDGVLGVNTPTVANIHFQVRTVAEDFLMASLSICEFAGQHMRQLIVGTPFINANGFVS